MTVVGVLLTASLGRWQLDRAAQKRALQARIEAQRRLPPLSGQQLVGAAQPAALLYRPIALRGHWLAQDTVYLDNRQMNGRPGFYVVSPLRLEGSQAVVLVQRGWAPRDFLDRTALPPVQTPPDEVRVQGRVAPAPSQLYALGGPERGRVRQNLELGAYRAETGLPLLDVTVVETGEPSQGLLRQWPDPAFGVDRHYGYAFQWFGLSNLMVVLYVWFQLVRRFVPARRP